MALVKQIAALCKELVELENKADKVDALEKEITELNKKLELEEELWKFILPSICPEEIEKKTNGLINGWFNQKLADSANDFLKRPKVLGYSVICTYLDGWADFNEISDSNYAIFLLLEDGKLIHICDLGIDRGKQRNVIPSAKEIIVREIFPEIKDVAKEAPACLKRIQEIMDSNIKRTK